mmetsp:Transcript_9802/g.11283  ORF Transcript_9802/g.11283 Transcript_9802/m.11283 type:complete len:86 (-) Transcript_9802:227-484(-)
MIELHQWTLDKRLILIFPQASTAACTVASLQNECAREKVAETKKDKIPPPIQIPRDNPTINSVGSKDLGAKFIWLLFVIMMTRKV